MRVGGSPSCASHKQCEDKEHTEIIRALNTSELNLKKKILKEKERKDNAITKFKQLFQ